jgi:hypothetical protein
MEFNLKITWAFSGDSRQCLPIVKFGKPHDIIEASLTSSSLWDKFEKCFLVENKRLKFDRPDGMIDFVYDYHCDKQKTYEAMILLIMYGSLIAAWIIWLFLAWLFPPIGWAIASAYIWVPIGLTVIYVACMIMVLVLVIFTASIIDKTR